MVSAGNIIRRGIAVSIFSGNVIRCEDWGVAFSANVIRTGTAVAAFSANVTRWEGCERGLCRQYYKVKDCS